MNENIPKYAHMFSGLVVIDELLGKDMEMWPHRGGMSLKVSFEVSEGHTKPGVLLSVYGLWILVESFQALLQCHLCLLFDMMIMDQPPENIKKALN